MVYNFNLGIGWASSGVEYAQSYRANLLRRAGIPARFIFTDMFAQENIEHMTKNIGFLDEEIIWLYTFFTDTKIAPVSYTLADFEGTISDTAYNKRVDGKVVTYELQQTGDFYKAYLVKEDTDLVHRVEYVSKGCLVRKDYFTYCRIYSEYYGPLDNKAHLYQRRFFNENGSIAYEEIIDNDDAMYRFPDRVLNSKQELIAYMTSCLNLTEDDVVIIDRTTGMGQAIMQNAAPARIGIVVHADHFSEGATDEEHILWNNFYEYSFGKHDIVSFYITATDAQNKLIREHFKKYVGSEPNVVTIPVGSLNQLKYPDGEREQHSLITASRLASEKHVDWIIEAAIAAKTRIQDLTLDIYGEGGEKSSLENIINTNHVGDYIHLKGQQNLTDVYKDYDAYISGSTSEGFGLTLMEAIGSGLPIIGFDVRYGNQIFIDDGINGFKIPVSDRMEKAERVQALSDCIVKLFTEVDQKRAHEHSYEIAKGYLTDEVVNKWKELIETAK